MEIEGQKYGIGGQKAKGLNVCGMISAEKTGGIEIK